MSGEGLQKIGIIALQLNSNLDLRTALAIKDELRTAKVNVSSIGTRETDHAELLIFGDESTKIADYMASVEKVIRDVFQQKFGFAINTMDAKELSESTFALFRFGTRE